MSFKIFTILCFITFALNSQAEFVFEFAGSYNWVDWSFRSAFPDDAVIGGQNNDFHPLFVVRGKGDNYNLYGKVPVPRYYEAFLTNDKGEFSINEIQVSDKIVSTFETPDINFLYIVRFSQQKAMLGANILAKVTLQQ